MICPTSIAEYFCKRGWTAIGDLPVRHNQTGEQRASAAAWLAIADSIAPSRWEGRTANSKLKVEFHNATAPP
jgi:hypothetical protein